MNKNAVLFLTCCIFLLNSVRAQWHQDKYVIGTFYDPQIKDCKLTDTIGYKKILQDVKDCHFNLLSGLDGCYDFKWISYKMSLLADLGLKSLQLSPTSLDKKDMSFKSQKATQWSTSARSLNNTKRDAFYGYLLFDEPLPKDDQAIKKWMSYLKKNDNNKLTYINLLPAWSFKSKDEYEKYADSFLSSNDPLEVPDVVSYDCYPFVKGGGIKPNYFYNLHILKQKAKGRPLWYYVLTTQHREYAEIGTSELNFMVFCPLIYGAKGTFYFTYQTIVGSTMPFGEALIAKNKPTSKYYLVQKINNFLEKVWGPIVMNSDNLGTYHVSEQPYNQAIEAGENIDSHTPLVANIDSKYVAFGVFKMKDSAESDILIVNKSGTALKNVSVKLKGNQPNVSLSVPYDTYDGKMNAFQTLSVKYDRASNQTACSIDLNPGEGRIIKLK